MLDLINDYDPSMSESSKVRKIIKGLKPMYLEKINPMTLTTVADVLEAIRKIAETQFLINKHADTNSIDTNVISTMMDGFSNLFKQQTEMINNIIKTTENKDKKVTFKEPGNSNGRSFQGRNQHTPLQCYACGKLGHITRNCWNQNTSSNPRSYVQCNTCGRLGHLSSSCYKNALCTACNKYGHTSQRCHSGNFQGRGRTPIRQAMTPPMNYRQAPQPRTHRIENPYYRNSSVAPVIPQNIS